MKFLLQNQILRFIKALMTEDGDIYKFGKTHPKTEGVVAEILKQSMHMVINILTLCYQNLTLLEIVLFESGTQSSTCQA